jgi:hypothetical protein
MDERTNAPTSEEVNEALMNQEDVEELQILKTPEERRIASILIPIILRKANMTAEVAYAKQLQVTVEDLKAQNAKAIENQLKVIRDANKPPTPEELEKLLSQEYATFTIEVIQRKGQKKQFTIRELPQATEMKFMRVIQNTLVPRLKELASVEWTNTSSVAEKMQRIIDIIPEAMDMLAECCAIALDPYSEEGITKEWVQLNLSSFRIMSIIEAQVTAGKFRDFFAALSRAIPGQTTV